MVDVFSQHKPSPITGTAVTPKVSCTSNDRALIRALSLPALHTCEPSKCPSAFDELLMSPFN